MLFTSDECWFQLTGYVNTQNCRIWGSEPPKEHVEVVTASEDWSLCCIASTNNDRSDFL